ncbi:hypothetical protein PG994_004833 [Apiospora phragmitis]|uniref:Uncharacterized protein n=1 Tax=Apiospora phragmitis TaxID=2905665 RepID=A0ABR1VRP9_9PEZI
MDRLPPEIKEPIVHLAIAASSSAKMARAYAAGVKLDLGLASQWRVDDEFPDPFSEESPYTFVSIPEDVSPLLPEVFSITRFNCKYVPWNNLSFTPKTCCKIASRFPNLKNIDWILEDGYQIAIGLSMLPNSVRKLSLEYGDMFRVGEEIGGYSPLCPQGILDSFSLALRKFSKQLEHLSLITVIGIEFFHDTHPNQDHEEEHWLRLRHLYVAPGAQTPQGRWLFDFDSSDPHLDRSDPVTYRIIPIPEQVNPYCLAFARAAERMPELKCMSILWPTLATSKLEYKVKGDSSSAEFRNESSPGLDLNDEIQDAWLTTARVHLREGAEFHFVVVDNGSRFTNRNVTKSRGTALLTVPEPYALIDWTRSRSGSYQQHIRCKQSA